MKYKRKKIKFTLHSNFYKGEHTTIVEILISTIIKLSSLKVSICRVIYGCLKSLRSFYIQNHRMKTMTAIRRATWLRVNWWFLAKEAAKKKIIKESSRKKSCTLLFSCLFCYMHSVKSKILI